MFNDFYGDAWRSAVFPLWNITKLIAGCLKPEAYCLRPEGFVPRQDNNSVNNPG
jgi:hypothetical protein